MMKTKPLKSSKSPTRQATGRARKSEAEAHSLRQHAKRLSEEAQAARRERDEENSRGEERRVELLALREVRF